MVLFYHLLAGLAIIAQLRCMLSDPGKYHLVLELYVNVKVLILGYVPLPKTKLDFNELEAKSSKKVNNSSVILV